MAPKKAIEGPKKPDVENELRTLAIKEAEEKLEARDPRWSERVLPVNSTPRVWVFKSAEPGKADVALTNFLSKLQKINEPRGTPPLVICRPRPMSAIPEDINLGIYLVTGLGRIQESLEGGRPVRTSNDLPSRHSWNRLVSCLALSRWPHNKGYQEDPEDWTRLAQRAAFAQGDLSLVFSDFIRDLQDDFAAADRGMPSGGNYRSEVPPPPKPLFVVSMTDVQGDRVHAIQYLLARFACPGIAFMLSGHNSWMDRIPAVSQTIVE